MIVGKHLAEMLWGACVIARYDPAIPLSPRVGH